MRKVILGLGVLCVAVVSLAQSYNGGHMVRWDVESIPYHGVTRKIAVYNIKYLRTTYSVTQGTAKPSELASQDSVQFRIDKKDDSLMYVKDKNGKEVKYSIISIGFVNR